MDSVQRSFRASVLAGGLVTAEQLREAESALRAAAGNTPAPLEITDAQLTAKLIELGYMNAWQAEQLQLGKAKFTLISKPIYRVIGSLGQGGMGQVFMAQHEFLGRVVAIKVLPPHKATPQAIASFHREIRAQAKLDHPNLVRALDAGHDGKVDFLVTEYVPGIDLRKMVRNRGPLTMQEAATIISQAATGLAHAHSRGLIHRDIKPGNLMVTPDGHTKVLDLGLAGFLGNEDLDDPRVGKVVGTADYLSPEHILAPRSVSPASDIYSLGCTLYYAVTGKVPFPGGTTREKARRHCEETPLKPRVLNQELSEEFVEVIAHMMAKDPQQRIGTAEEVVSRLAPWATATLAAGAADLGDRASPSAQSRSPDGSALSDTPGGYLDYASERSDDSPSQLSQRTDPAAALGEETLPEGFAANGSSKWPGGWSPLWALLVLSPLLAAAGLLLVSLVMKAFS